MRPRPRSQWLKSSPRILSKPRFELGTSNGLLPLEVADAGPDRGLRREKSRQRMTSGDVTAQRCVQSGGSATSP